MNICKLAQLVEMSLDVPSSEKKVAKQIVSTMEKVCKKIEQFDEHLDLIYNPLKNNETASKESVIENRGAIKRYTDKIEENFDELTEMSLLVIRDLNVFSTDGHIKELIKSFTNAFGDVEDSVKSLIASLDDWKSEEYRDNVLVSIENAKKQAAQVYKLLNERIIEHINTNIIANTWVDNVSDKLNITIQEREPYIKRLHREREEKLREVIR